MCCVKTCAVVLAFALIDQYSGIALSPPTVPFPLHNTGVPSCPATPDAADERNKDRAQVHNDGVPSCQVLSSFEAAKESVLAGHNDSLAGCKFVASVIGLVEQYAAHLDLNYINLIVQDLALVRSLCHPAAWRLLAGRRRAGHLTCSHLHSVWQSSQEEAVLRGLTVVVLLPAGRLRPVLRRKRTSERLLVVSRDGVSLPTRPPPDISWLHAQLRTNNCTADLTEVWTFPNDQPSLIEPRGYWSAATGLCLRRKRADGPISFQGRTVRFATTNDSGDVIYDAANNGALRKIGLHGDMITFLEKELQLRAEIVLPPGGQFCNDSSDVLCGPLGMLGRRQAGVAVGHFRIHTESLGIVDFTTALQDYSYSFVVANPNRQTSAAQVNWRAYSKPFTASVWLCSAGMALLVWLVWCLLQWVDRDRHLSPAETGWSVLCMSLQQGAELVPHSISARQVVGCFWIFCVILLASYTSNIISLLVSVDRALPFTTLAELGARRGWVVAVQPGSPAAALLQGRPELDNHEIVYQPSLKDSLERILHDDKFTVFTGHTEAESLVRGSCGLSWTPIRLGVTHAHWALQKHLPYGGRIKNVLSRLVEAGVVARSQRPWAISNEACRLPTASFQTISPRHTLTAFALLALGALASLALLGAEVLLHRRDAPLLLLERRHHPHSGRRRPSRPDPPVTQPGTAPGDTGRPGPDTVHLTRQGAVRRSGGRRRPSPAYYRQRLGWPDPAQR